MSRYSLTTEEKLALIVTGLILLLDVHAFRRAFSAQPQQPPQELGR